MGWIVWFSVVALVAGTGLVWFFCEGVLDLTRDKRGER